MTEDLQDLLGHLHPDFQGWYVPEPPVSFGRGQQADDPKGGIALYGPCGDDSDTPLARVRVGIIGTGGTIEKARHWLTKCRSRVVASPDSGFDPHLFPAFPGFE